ncbi:DUF3892 domain-containing protein [Clostridium akagii]|uniref:DUF3892 domain-containing protein n=1 Tax=Clostridium akagii TaxID=91623 RepID=UPI000A04B8C6|nr:DUF3892 domain-containing protein [Clostridium akagii]
MTFGFKNSHVIKKVVTNNNGDTIAYGLENGDIIMKEEALSMVYQGTISGVRLEKDSDGNEYLTTNDTNDDNFTSIPNVNHTNNLN